MENPDLIPQTSIWPILIGLGLALLLAGVVYSPVVSAIGLVLFLFSLGGLLHENRTLTRIYARIERQYAESPQTPDEETRHG